jgi:hypothetical protein
LVDRKHSDLQVRGRIVQSPLTVTRTISTEIGGRKPE